MTRYTLILLVAVAVLVSMVLVPIAIADADGDDGDDVAPGERLMGGVAAQEAELHTEVDERAFGQAIATAMADGDTEALAGLLADRADRLEANVTELEARLAYLEAEHEAGNLSTGEFRAEIAKLEVERQSLVRVSDLVVNATMGLPDDVLDERGINVTAIERLQATASELGGQEVRDIARSIAGPHVGNASPDRPSPGDRMLGQIDRFDDPDQSIAQAERLVDRAEAIVDQGIDQAELVAGDTGPGDGVDDEVWAMLDDAEHALDDAMSALANAEDALEAGDEETAVEYAVEAAEHAMTAIEHANDALSQLRGPPGVPGGGVPGGS